ncbi:MAG: hypothetical protein Q8J62_05370, partial [Candidatus Cloacimonadaceae bacterium]|nr:hypothetical protein [Candidatus Cloacimonadaceae bacterium]
EDFYTEYGGLNVLNNEDKNSDGVLILDEDTGLDGIRWGEPGHDPNDKASNEMDQLGDYPYINNTEGNRVLDTEDLDGNGVLNQLDRYFSYTISLTDSLYLENINHDGWRLYRIPLTDPNAYQIVNNSTSGVLANLKKISFGRIMLETDVNAKVLIADVSVVGNKWQDFLVRYKNNLWLTPADMNFYNTSYISGIVNNQKNRSHYTSPEGTVYIEDRRESSESALTLNIQNLHYGHQVLLRQRSIDSFSLLSYGKIKFWVYPEASDISPIYPDSINIVFRIGADSLHYYEIRERVPVNPYMLKMDKNRWMEFTYDLQQVTALKQNDPTATHGEITIGTTTYGFRGTPTLTNVRDVYLGVLNPDDTQSPMAFSGTLYYNDLRVAEPYEDIGIANRISLSSVFADLSTLSIDFEEKSENFNPVIQRGRSNTFTRSTTFNISNKYFLNKFFPQTWSLDIPVTLTRSYTLGIPRYRANSDLLRENITDPAEKERERSESLLYAAEFGFSQRTAPKNKILLYSIYRSSLSGRIENSFRHTPTAVDTTFTWRGTYNYNIGFPSDKVSLKLFKNYRLGFFPTTWNNSFTLNKTDPKSWNWELRDNVYSWRPRAQVIPTFILNTDTNINWGLTSDIAATIRLNSKRDLIQEVLIQKVNVGKLADYTQDLGLNFNPNYLRRYFNFTASGTTRFAENQRKYFENTPDGQIERYQSDGSSNRTLRTNLTLMNSNLLGSWAENLANRHNSRKEAKSAQSSTEDQKKSDTDKKTEEDLKREEERKREEQNKAEESKTNDPSDPKADERSGDPGMGYPENRDADMQAPPAEPGKPYTPPKGVSFLPATMIGYLSKIKNVTASYQNTYTMNYTRKDERPPFAFQIGLPHSVPHGFLDSTGDDNTLTLSSGLMFSRKLDSVLNYSYTINKRYSNASNQTVATTFPDLTLSLMGVEEWFGLGKYLSGSRLNTGFQYTVRSNGDIDWIKPKQEMVGMSFNPLIGFTGSIMKVVNTNLSYTMTKAENTTDMETYEIIKTTDTRALNGNVSYSFRAGRGFTVPFTQKKIHIRNELTSSLAFVYENNFDETFGRDSSQIDRDSSRLAFTPGATYQFDQNIRGGLTGSYEITNDRKRDDGVRIFRLGVWVEINL